MKLERCSGAGTGFRRSGGSQTVGRNVASGFAAPATPDRPRQRRESHPAIAGHRPTEHPQAQTGERGMRAVGGGRAEGGAHSRVVASRQRVPYDDLADTPGVTTNTAVTARNARYKRSPHLGMLLRRAVRRGAGPERGACPVNRSRPELTRQPPRTRPRTRVDASVASGFLLRLEASEQPRATAGCRRCVESARKTCSASAAPPWPAGPRPAVRVRPAASPAAVVAEAILGDDRAGERLHRRRCGCLGFGDPAREIGRCHGDMARPVFEPPYRVLCPDPRRGLFQRLLLRLESAPFRAPPRPRPA